MTIFKLTAPITVTAYTEVEADTIEKAREIAAGRSAVIGGPMSGYDASEHWIIDDADGEVSHDEIGGDEELTLSNGDL